YQLKGNELDYILDNAGARIVFADDDLIEAVTSTATGTEAEVIDLASLAPVATARSEEHTSELQSRFDIVCRLLLEKKKKEIEEIQERRYHNNCLQDQTNPH